MDLSLRILDEMDLSEHLITLIRSLTEDISAYVRIDNDRSPGFHTRAGVRQGCVLSPILFNTYSEYAMKKILDWWDRRFSVGEYRINNLTYGSHHLNCYLHAGFGEVYQTDRDSAKN